MYHWLYIFNTRTISNMYLKTMSFVQVRKSLFSFAKFKIYDLRKISVFVNFWCCLKELSDDCKRQNNKFSKIKTETFTEYKENTC